MDDEMFPLFKCAGDLTDGMVQDDVILSCVKLNIRRFIG